MSTYLCTIVQYRDCNEEEWKTVSIPDSCLYVDCDLKGIMLEQRMIECVIPQEIWEKVKGMYNIEQQLYSMKWSTLQQLVERYRAEYLETIEKYYSVSTYLTELQKALKYEPDECPYDKDYVEYMESRYLSIVGYKNTILGMVYTKCPEELLSDIRIIYYFD